MRLWGGRFNEETDARVATLPVDRLWPADPDSPLYAVRALHRGEHLDDVEEALRGRPAAGNDSTTL